MTGEQSVKDQLARLPNGVVAQHKLTVPALLVWLRKYRARHNYFTPRAAMAGYLHAMKQDFLRRDSIRNSAGS